MTLTKLPLNRRDERVRRDLSDVQAAHRMVQTLVAGRREEEQLLWGVLAEQSALVVSHALPVPHHAFPPGYLAGSPETYPAADLTAGAAVSLRGMVNPTASEFRPGQRGVRRFITGEAGREEWLRRQLGSGFQLIRYREVAEVCLRGLRGGRQVSIRAVDVRVTCKVTDEVAARRLLEGGVGRGRAYGCGLLLPHV